MRPLLFTFVFTLFLASVCQNTIAQQSILNGASEEQWEGDLETQEDQEAESQEEQEAQEDPVEPTVRPQLKRVSEISLKLFDQPLLNTEGELQVPQQTPMPAGNLGPQSYGGASPKVVYWTAPNVGYRQLIFEEPGLERHGFSLPETRQNILSGAKFYARAIALPIIVHRQKQCPCDNNLGWGTPGTCPR